MIQSDKDFSDFFGVFLVCFFFFFLSGKKPDPVKNCQPAVITHSYIKITPGHV